MALFGGKTVPASPFAGVSMADGLRALAGMVDSGALTVDSLEEAHLGAAPAGMGGATAKEPRQYQFVLNCTLKAWA